MKVTSASPIISAAAVAAVRPGFLRVFSPESRSVAGSKRTLRQVAGEASAREAALDDRITSQMTSTTSVTTTAATPK